MWKILVKNAFKKSHNHWTTNLNVESVMHLFIVLHRLFMYQIKGNFKLYTVIKESCHIFQK